MKHKLLYKVLITLSLFIASNGIAQQADCPPNMGFENGTFENWECYQGSVSQMGAVTLSPMQPISNVHTINDVTVTPPALDPYGKFPVNCPNGSRYSIRLGNDINGAQSERVSYTFTVPANKNDYSIIYNYAVVFQNPSHQSYQQPRFTSQVFDVTAGTYVSCGSFEFVASSGLAGFQLSELGQNVYYKPWSPITINLNGYAGKTIRLEFTNNDCTLGGHFGYAYLDVNENCASPITGNVICGSPDSIRLKAPFGFQQYFWYDASFTTLLGTSNTLLVTPAPPANTTYALQIVPYPNLGCQDTLYTKIEVSPEPFVFKTPDSVQACSSAAVNLTAASVTQGSMPGLKFTYFKDPGEVEYVVNPSAVTTSGTYYIKAVSPSGCSDIRGVRVIIRGEASLVITEPPQACAPGKIDLTAPSITAGSQANLAFTYWSDPIGTIPLQNPAALAKTGVYYIRSTDPMGCTNIKPVGISIADLVVNNPSACGQADITKPEVTDGSTPLLKFSYWQDAATTQALAAPEQVTVTGGYFIKGVSASGCSITKPVQVQINPFPTLTIKDPGAVMYPATVSLATTFTTLPNINYTYWQNASATTPLTQPITVGTPGTYFIKGTTQLGCSIIKPVLVTITPPFVPRVIAPNAFSPNGDGVNDVFKTSIEGVAHLYHLKIYNRYGQEVFETPRIEKYWDGTADGKLLPVGIYYWVFEGTDTYRNTKVKSSGSVTLLK